MQQEFYNLLLGWIHRELHPHSSMLGLGGCVWGRYVYGMSMGMVHTVHAMYVLGGVLGILFGSICFPWGEGSISIHGFLYKVLLMPVFGETSCYT